jgi:uncharacterized protein with NRDE domain
MCTLLIARHLAPGWPLVIAANRDEQLTRPWEPPAPLPGHHDVLCPRDTVAGGTWIGVRATGLVVGITNRLGLADFAPARPSRGQLALAALDALTVRAATAAVHGTVAAATHNGFNLLLADASDAVVLSYGPSTGLGALELGGPGPAAHVLTNRHDLDHPELADVRAALARALPSTAGVEALLEALVPLLADHRPRSDGHAICKHGATYGTVCSSIIAVPESGAPRFWFAAGPACVTAFTSIPWPVP